MVTNYDDQKGMETEKRLKYFTTRELRAVTHTDSGLVIDDPYIFYSPDLLEKLDSMRHRCGIPIILSSGYRSISYNRKVGGVPGSSHTKGLAMDICCTDSEHRYLYLRAALAAGFTRIGISDKFMHLDIDPDKVQNRIWTY